MSEADRALVVLMAREIAREEAARLRLAGNIDAAGRLWLTLESSHPGGVRVQHGDAVEAAPPK